MHNCTPGLRISRSISQTSQFVFELGISVPSLRTCISSDRSHPYREDRWRLHLFLWSSKSSEKPLWQTLFDYVTKCLVPKLNTPKKIDGKCFHDVFTKLWRFFCCHQCIILSVTNYKKKLIFFYLMLLICFVIDIFYSSFYNARKVTLVVTKSLI